ncbi:collagen-like protein [Yeosuana marina]|uniref:collagen-like triple helix repeat-containing protein n=1 Tax=Yeosuana marina TaxID=1565536 RepID=UPI0030EEF0E9|tara:strand:- start:6180 stop:6695 length:516 start_codon:yes stop_codon:yes gene_type:complete
MACSKEGDQGPIGPQGEQGIPGVDGEQGEAGTANVIYSDWIASGFESPIVGANASFSIENIEELTDEIKSTGVIMVYGRYTDTYTHIEPLPKSIFGLRMQYYDFQVNDVNQNIAIWISSIDGSDIGIPIYDDYRYIIIPGGVPSSEKSAIDYSKMDYKEVLVHFNISESSD